MNHRGRNGVGARRRGEGAARAAACALMAATALAGARPAGARPAAASAGPVAKGARPAPPARAKTRKGLRDSVRGLAREAFDRGVMLFEAKNPSGAFAEFERAYELSKDPRLLFNMALADRDQRRFARAVSLLQREQVEGAGVLSAEELTVVRRALAAFLPFTTLLTVDCDQPGASVFVDDAPVGTTPLAEPVRVDVGERRVSARKDGFRDASATRSAASGTPLSVVLTLEPRGKLVVRARGVAAARVAVDGVEVGGAPWEGEVPAGAHVITVSAGGFVSKARHEVVARGATTVLDVAMQSDQGRLRVESDDDGGVIAIDGRPVGKGTWEGALGSGPHSLLVKRDGAEPYSTELTVLRDQTRTVQVSLRSRSIGWYWYVGGGLLLAGAAATTAFVLARDGEPTTTGAGGTLNPNRTLTSTPLPVNP
jgi:PEGA domain-containing protein